MAVFREILAADRRPRLGRQDAGGPVPQDAVARRGDRRLDRAHPLPQGRRHPLRHSHASNQFMFCLSGRYRYVPTGLTLTPGSFYWNPKGA